MLTTDYSSIYSDYLMLNRPSVLFPYDYEEYSKDTRECYFEYNDYMPEKRAYNMQEFMDAIKSTFKDDRYEEGRIQLRNKIFEKSDGFACSRLYKKIKKLLNI